MAGHGDTGRRLDELLRTAETRLDRVESALENAPSRDEPAAAAPRPAEEAARAHVLFVPSPTAYALVERDGPAPDLGATVELAGVEGLYAVVKVARSPLPGDRRRWAYLELT